MRSRTSTGVEVTFEVRRGAILATFTNPKTQESMAVWCDRWGRRKGRRSVRTR